LCKSASTRGAKYRFMRLSYHLIHKSRDLCGFVFLKDDFYVNAGCLIKNEVRSQSTTKLAN
jgi:hypothetical protein